MKQLHQAVVGFFGLLDIPGVLTTPEVQYNGHELAGPGAPETPGFRDHNPEPSARVMTAVATIGWIFGWLTGHHQGAR